MYAISFRTCRIGRRSSIEKSPALYRNQSTEKPCSRERSARGSTRAGPHPAQVDVATGDQSHEDGAAGGHALIRIRVPPLPTIPTSAGGWARMRRFRIAEHRCNIRSGRAGLTRGGGPIDDAKNDERIPVVYPQHRRTRPPRRRHDGGLGLDRVLDRPRTRGGGARLGRRAARHRVGAARHLHRRHGAGGADHELQAVDRGPSRLLAAGPLRELGGDARPAQSRARAGQHRQRTGQSRRVRRREIRPRPALRPYARVHAPGSAPVDRGRRHVQRRALPGRRLHGRATSLRRRRVAASRPLFRRRVRGRGTRVGGRSGCATVLG